MSEITRGQQDSCGVGQRAQAVRIQAQGLKTARQDRQRQAHQAKDDPHPPIGGYIVVGIIASVVGAAVGAGIAIYVNSKAPKP